MSLFPASKRAAKFLSAKISVVNQTFWIFDFFSPKEGMIYCEFVKQATSVISGSYNNISCAETNVLY